MELVPKVRKCNNTQLNDFVRWNRRLNELLSDKYARLMSCIERDANDTENDFADCPAGQWPKEVCCTKESNVNDALFVAVPRRVYNTADAVRGDPRRLSQQR